MNAFFKEWKRSLNVIGAANTYLDSLLQTKTYLQLLILILFCIAIILLAQDYTNLHNKSHYFNYNLFNIVWKLIWTTPSFCI
ncbi:hypothetical protein AT265_09665 [Bacillus cereus]|nr:hypothetical protein AT265_09665 [Bacillus cereus]